MTGGIMKEIGVGIESERAAVVEIMIGNATTAVTEIGNARAAVTGIGNARTAETEIGNVRAAVTEIGNARAAVTEIGNARAAETEIGNGTAAMKETLEKALAVVTSMGECRMRYRLRGGLPTLLRWKGGGPRKRRDGARRKSGCMQRCTHGNRQCGRLLRSQTVVF
jgi:hypothetical protein